MTRRLGLLIDQERCIGCEACTVACRIENRGETGWIRVSTLPGNRKDAPTGVFPDLKMIFRPSLCNHCDRPPCAEACPAGAIEKREDGVVILREERCDGCSICLDACPYGAILYNSGKGRAEKCNLCIHRITDGLEPFCVICCEGQALHFGDLNDPESAVARAVASGNPYRLRPEEGTGPGVFYLPPRKPRGL